jgi:hypothetical protein
MDTNPNEALALTTMDEQEEAPSTARIPLGGLIEEILAMDLPLLDARAKLMAEFDRRYLSRVLAEHGGNVSRAAAASGIARRNFQILRVRRGV